MKCPIKLQEIKLINGVGDFSTKGFTVFGAHAGDGPWVKLFGGALEKGTDEVLTINALLH